MASEQKVEISGAICAPPPVTTNSEPTKVHQQPRQPTSMQGLLKFAMEATKVEDAPANDSQFQPLDEDRKRFLQQALNSLTIDVIEVIMKNIRVLEQVNAVKGDEDASEHIQALETISDYVCDIDTANDFHKIGGFLILQPCLKCNSPQVRAQACNLVAELSQNNPYCQQILLENGFMPILLNIVENDSEVSVKVKALYAISCNVRQNSLGYAQLIQYRGIQIFLDVLKKNIEKCNIKICFLLTALCQSQPDFKNRLVFFDYLEVLFKLLENQPQESHEHILSLLAQLIENNAVTKDECKHEKYNAKNVLENFVEAVNGKEEFENAEEYANSILHTLYNK